MQVGKLLVLDNFVPSISVDPYYKCVMGSISEMNFVIVGDFVTRGCRSQIHPARNRA